MKSFAAGGAFAASLFVLASMGLAQDFINYRGPTGNGTYPGVGLLKEWPKNGPELLWKYKVGPGWAAPAIVDGKVYALGGRIGQLWILDLEGNLQQRLMVGSMEWKRFVGSRGVPIIKNGMLVANAPNANYWGIDIPTGEVRWQLNAWKSFGDGKGSQTWGVPESPMLIDNKVIFSTCSRTNQVPAFVALDYASGKMVWGMKTTKKYSAADVSSSWGVHNGRKLYFAPSWCYTSCLDADTGELLWDIPDNGEKSFTPIYQNGRLLFGDTKMGLHMLELSHDGGSYTEVWSRSNAYAYCTHAAIVEGKIFTYGNPSKRPIRGPGMKSTQTANDGNAPDNESLFAGTSGKTADRFMCLDADTGKLIHAVERGFGGGGAMGSDADNAGTIIAADGMVYFVNRIDGTNLRMTLIQPTPKGFVEKGSFVMTDKPADADERWVCPAVLEGRLFIRWGHLYCYDVRADPASIGARLDGSGVYGVATPPIKWGMARNMAWKQALPAASGSSPVVAGSNVFVTTAPHTLHCLKAEDGSIVWSKTHTPKDVGLEFKDSTPSADTVFQTPVVSKGTVYASFPNGVVAAYDLAGNRAWVARVEPSGKAVSPRLCRNLLLVPGKTLTALDAATGKEAWTYKSEPAVSTPAYLYASGEPAVVTDAGALLNLAGGKELAKDILGKGGPFLLTADMKAFRVYAAGIKDGKFAVKAIALPEKADQKAKSVWSVDVKGSALATVPLLYGGRLYLIGADRELVVLDANTGDEIGRLALDPAKASNSSAEPHLAVAGRRLYVHNVGKENLTVVLDPGPKPSVLWQYGADAPVAASGFQGESQVVRAGANLWALKGKTPVEPREVKIPTIEPQSFLSSADGKAPILPFASTVVPANWLFAGPCYPSTTMTNFLSSLGGIETVAPVDGLSVRAGYTTITFHQAQSNDMWKMGQTPAFELTAQTKRKPGTIYAYTIIENDKDRYVEYNPLGSGQVWRDFGKSLAANSWLSGVPVDQGSVFVLKKGRHGLLIQAAVGKPDNDWGKIFMTPHLLDVDEKTIAKLKQYSEDMAYWTEYAKTKDQPMVLK